MPPPCNLFVRQSLCSRVSGLRSPGPALDFSPGPSWAFGSGLAPQVPPRPAGHRSSPFSEGSFHLPRKAALLERPVPVLQKGKLRNIQAEWSRDTQREEWQTERIRGSVSRSQEAPGGVSTEVEPGPYASPLPDLPASSLSICTMLRPRRAQGHVTTQPASLVRTPPGAPSPGPPTLSLRRLSPSHRRLRTPCG